MSGSLGHNAPENTGPPTDYAPVKAAFTRVVSLAADTLGATAPNPSVGCALLDVNGQILVAAAHPRAGEAHAEALALRLAHEAGVFDRIATAVVTLEPCNHTGRTPPCAEALLQSPVRQIWIGARDPNPVASGGGQRLLSQGRDVRFLDKTPSLSRIERDCAALIAPFAHKVQTGQPWISVKQAVRADGGMAPDEGRKTFTESGSLLLAHRLRRATDAIVTGIGTVLADDPAFTVRRLSDHAGRMPRHLIVCDRAGRLPAAYAKAVEARGFMLSVCRDLGTLPDLLAETGANWAMIEAGPKLLHAIRMAGLWEDWLRITHAPPKPDRISITTREAVVSPLSLLVARHDAEAAV